MPKDSLNAEQHVVFSCHLMKYLNPMTQRISVVATQLDDDISLSSNIQECDRNEERIYATYICDAEGKLVKKLLFFESDYRKALKHEFERRLANTMQEKQQS